MDLVEISSKNKLSMERNFKLYLHGELTKFEADFNKFVLSPDKELVIRSDNNIYLHTVYKFLKEAYHFTQEETDIYLDYKHMPAMNDDLIPNMVRNSRMDFKVNITRDRSISPPLVVVRLTKLD